MLRGPIETHPTGNGEGQLATETGPPPLYAGSLSDRTRPARPFL